MGLLRRRPLGIRASIRANFSSQLDVRVRGAFDALEFFQTLTLAARDRGSLGTLSRRHSTTDRAPRPWGCVEDVGTNSSAHAGNPWLAECAQTAVAV